MNLCFKCPAWFLQVFSKHSDDPYTFFYTVESSVNMYILQNSSRYLFKVNNIQAYMLVLVVSNPKEVMVTSFI